jgi:hypothetical protein
MAELHETLMGRKLIEHVFSDIAENLGKIADAIKEINQLLKKDTIELSISYYEDENGKKVYDIEHMQKEFDNQLKNLKS